MFKRFKSYCSNCKKVTGRFITAKESYRHSGRCLKCQIEKVDEILNSVNPVIGR